MRRIPVPGSGMCGKTQNGTLAEKSPGGRFCINPFLPGSIHVRFRIPPPPFGTAPCPATGRGRESGSYRVFFPPSCGECESSPLFPKRRFIRLFFLCISTIESSSRILLTACHKI